MECTHLWGSSHVPIVLGRNCYVDSYGFHMRGVFFHTQREDFHVYAFTQAIAMQML